MDTLPAHPRQHRAYVGCPGLYTTQDVAAGSVDDATLYDDDDPVAAWTRYRGEGGSGAAPQGQNRGMGVRPGRDGTGIYRLTGMTVAPLGRLQTLETPDGTGRR